ncbi:MAG TPA: nitrile hydratase accessory protein [Caldimonas sp.]
MTSAPPAQSLGLPSAADGPVFREPWEAHAFALALALHQRGVFTWTEWAAALARQIEAAQARGDADLGDTYYRHWLAALEAIVAEKGAGSTDELARYCDAWDRAAKRTPHGRPIELSRADFGV